MKYVCVVLSLVCVSYLLTGSEHSNGTRISHHSKQPDQQQTIQIQIPASQTDSASVLSKKLTPDQQVSILYRVIEQLTTSHSLLVKTLSFLTASITPDQRRHRSRRSSARYSSRDHQQEQAQLASTSYPAPPSLHPAYRRIASQSSTPPVSNGISYSQHSRSRPYLHPSQ